MYKRYRITTVLLGMAILVAGSAISAGAVQTKGDSSLQFSGGFFHADGADSGTLNLDVGYGYFLNERWEVGVLQSVGYSFIDDADDEWIASTIPFINYHFTGLSTSNAFQPFIGAFIGASYNDDDATGTIGPQLGFRSFINDTTFVLVKYRYEWFFDDLTIDDIKDTRSDGNHVISMGIGFVF